MVTLYCNYPADAFDASDCTSNSMTFFQIRGVLNKITPEKFEKLTVDILNVGLDSTIVLKGVILLVRERHFYQDGPLLG